MNLIEQRAELDRIRAELEAPMPVALKGALWVGFFSVAVTLLSPWGGIAAFAVAWWFKSKWKDDPEPPPPRVGMELSEPQLNDINTALHNQRNLFVSLHEIFSGSMDEGGR